MSPFKGALPGAGVGRRALDDYTVEFKLQGAVRGVSRCSWSRRRSCRRVGRRDLRTLPIGTGPVSFVRYDVDDQVVLAAFDDYWEGAPKNAGVVLKVIPDDTMRGLELRKGSVDVVVNDLPPDIVHQLETSGDFAIARSPGLDFSYIGFNMRDPRAGDKRVRHAIGYRHQPRRDRPVSAARSRAPGDRADAAAGVGVRAARLPVHLRPGAARCACSTRRAIATRMATVPLPRLRLSLQDLDQRGSASAVRPSSSRTCAGSASISTCGRPSSRRCFADVVKGNFQMFSLQWVGGASGRSRHPAARVSLDTGAAGRLQSRLLRNQLVDRLIDRASTATDDEERRRLYGEAQKLVAEDALPLIPMWNRTNVVVSQRTLSGLHLGPTGDFSAIRAITRDR